MSECKHLLQMRNNDGTISCLVCDTDVADGPITPFPGAVGNIADDPLLDYLARGGVDPRYR
jgi:hypothetical protein